MWKETRDCLLFVCEKDDKVTEVPVATEAPTPTEAPAPTAPPEPTATPIPTEAPKQYNRDASYVMTGTRSDGSSIEVVIEYDSSVVGYELTEGVGGWIVNGRELPSGPVTYMYALDEEKWGPFGYPMIRTGSASCENYKKDFLEHWTDMGALNPSIYDLEEVTVNGYTYYYFEETLEEFVNTSFYIKEVTTVPNP